MIKSEEGYKVLIEAKDTPMAVLESIRADLHYHITQQLYDIAWMLDVYGMIDDRCIAEATQLSGLDFTRKSFVMLAEEFGGSAEPLDYKEGKS